MGIGRLSIPPCISPQQQRQKVHNSKVFEYFSIHCIYTISEQHQDLTDNHIFRYNLFFVSFSRTGIQVRFCAYREKFTKMNSGPFYADQLWGKEAYNVATVKELFTKLNKLMNCKDFLHLSHHRLARFYHVSLLHSFLSSISLFYPFLLLSVSKGQMFPADTLVPHWYSALTLAQSCAVVSASSDHTEIRHGACTEVLEGAWKIKGSENYERNGKERTDRKAYMDTI